jgi:acetoacetate decarboxylase
MHKKDVLELPSMPAAGPSYPASPYRFVNREYMVITYETDPQALAMDLPEPLEPVEHALVHFEWIKMPDSSGFGSYTESGMVIPCRFRGEDVNFVAQMYLDDDRQSQLTARSGAFPRNNCATQARHRKGYADRDARICGAARGHGHHGVQAREHGGKR